jgi:hypothetical protein
MQKTANAISKHIAGHTLTQKEKATSSSARRWASSMEQRRSCGDRRESDGGSLAGAPLDAPPAIHAYGLAVHLVYGATTDVVRRAIRAALG